MQDWASHRFLVGQFGIEAHGSVVLGRGRGVLHSHAPGKAVSFLSSTLTQLSEG